MARLLAHQKQYVLGPAPVRVRPDWIAVEVAADLVLSHCPKLRVTRLRSRDGRDYYLLGLAVPADQPVASLAEAFRSKDLSEIENWTGFWAGKWLLVSRERCWQDASGCLGVHHRTADGALWISSSPALLSDHLPGARPAAHLPWRIAHTKGMDWIPSPFTTREGVGKLLPLRTIDPRTGSQRPVHFVRPNMDTSDDPAALASSITTVLGNWARCDFSDWWLALTAGVDTRTNLAAACAAGLKVRTFTIGYSHIDRRDLVVPPRVAARAGVPYEARSCPQVDPDEARARVAAISEHMDGANFHPSFDYLAYCDDTVMDDPGRTFAHGVGYGIGRCVFWGRFAKAGLGATPPTSADQVLDAFTFRSSWRPEPLTLWRQAIQAWIDSLAEPAPLALDWRDRFFLDQRLGSWSCNVERGDDLFGGTPFNPAHCLWVFHLLLQSDPANRRAGAAQRAAIGLTAPRLLEIPINPRPLPERLKRTAKRLLGSRAVQRLKSLARSMRGQ